MKKLFILFLLFSGCVAHRPEDNSNSIKEGIWVRNTATSQEGLVVLYDEIFHIKPQVRLKDGKLEEWYITECEVMDHPN